MMFEEGSACTECNNGVLEYQQIENCYCHLTAPCHFCVHQKLECCSCGEVYEHEEEEFPKIVSTEFEGLYVKINDKPKTIDDLDKTKIDYLPPRNSYASMVYTGVYPENEDDSEIRSKIRDKLKGSFGGRFNYFRNGRFEFVAYTD